MCRFLLLLFLFATSLLVYSCKPTSDDVLESAARNDNTLIVKMLQSGDDDQIAAVAEVWPQNHFILRTAWNTLTNFSMQTSTVELFFKIASKKDAKYFGLFVSKNISSLKDRQMGDPNIDRLLNNFQYFISFSKMLVPLVQNPKYKYLIFIEILDAYRQIYRKSQDQNNLGHANIFNYAVDYLKSAIECENLKININKSINRSLSYKVLNEIIPTFVKTPVSQLPDSMISQCGSSDDTLQAELYSSIQKYFESLQITQWTNDFEGTLPSAITGLHIIRVAKENAYIENIETKLSKIMDNCIIRKGKDFRTEEQQLELKRLKEERASYVFVRGYIVAIIGQKTYEVSQLTRTQNYYMDPNNPLGVISESWQTVVSPHAILITTNTIYSSAGMFSMWAKQIGKREVPLQNGFTATWEVWEEAQSIKPLDSMIKLFRKEIDSIQSEEKTSKDAYKKDFKIAKELISKTLGWPKYVEEKTIAKYISRLNKDEMVFVKGGTFQMGCNDNERERPVHSVTVKSFYIDKYEVTVEQYKKYCKATGTDMPVAPNWGWNDDDPIVNVSWNDANAYAQWAVKRLPTEAEWEYAARGGQKSKGYEYSGSDKINIVAWYSNNSTIKAHPVGTKQPNELGIYDMSGNVEEWCSDRWEWDLEKHEAHYYQYSPQDNPQGPSSGTSRILRGGSWAYLGYYCRVAARHAASPDDLSDNYGFRLVREN